MKKRGWLWNRMVVAAAVISLILMGCGKEANPDVRPSSVPLQSQEKHTADPKRYMPEEGNGKFRKKITDPTDEGRKSEESEIQKEQTQTESKEESEAALAEESETVWPEALMQLHLFIYPEEYEGDSGSFHYTAQYDTLSLLDEGYPQIQEKIREYNHNKELGAKEAGNYTTSQITLGRADGQVVSFSEQFIYSKEFHIKYNWETKTGREILFQEVVTDPQELYEYLERKLLWEQEIAAQIRLSEGWENGLRERVELGQDGLSWYLTRGSFCIAFDCSNFPYIDSGILIEIPVSEGSAFLNKAWFYTVSDYEKDVKKGNGATPKDRADQIDKIADSYRIYFYEDLKMAGFEGYDAYYDGRSGYPRWIYVYDLKDPMSETQSVKDKDYAYDGAGNLIRVGIPRWDMGDMVYFYYENERFTGERAPDGSFFPQNRSEHTKEAQQYLLEAQKLYQQSECIWD